MKATFLTFALILAATPAFAGKQHIDLNDLAAETDMSARQVAMVLGASGAYPEFKASYAQMKSKFVAAVGQRRYEALVVAVKAQENSAALAARSADS